LRGLFVTGTDTGVGKTVLAAAIVASLRGSGHRVAALKPLITGLDEPAGEDWPADHELLARAAGSSAEEVALVRFGAPVSPHLAAELEGQLVDLDDLLHRIRQRGAESELTIVEGVGGLLVPLGGSSDVRTLALSLGLPLVIAARPGLGTINHTLLTLEAARNGGLRVAGVVLTPWPREPSVIERSNLETIARLGRVEVAVLRSLERADPELLADAGAMLPLERWLSLT
jgi:dethiobiotin synthetase